jgi:uncharacterized protein YdaU (DUF1376 family)
MKDIWFSFYIGDYQKDTQHLDATEHGCYLNLLLFCYNNNGRFQANKDRLLRVARLNNDQRNVLDYILEEFFDLDGDEYTHKRVTEELNQIQERSEKAREKAEKRWSKKKKDTTDELQQCYSNATAVPGDMLGTCKSHSQSHSINSLSSAVGERFEKARKTWNDAELPKYPYSALNTPPDDMRLCMPTFNAHTDEEIAEAIGNYQRIRDGTGYQLDPVYQSFIGFMKAGKGVDKYVSAAEPFERCKVNGSSKQDQTMAKAKQVYDIVRRSS